MPSKIGLGYLGRGADQFLLDAGMRCSKWVNNPPPANLPADFTAVWRWVELPDNINGHFGEHPEMVAMEWVRRQLPHFFDIPSSAFVEGPNESDCENPDQAAWYARFEIERMKMMDLIGIRCCIGNFGTGRPALPVRDPGGVEIWSELLPMLRYARAHGHILGMHAYEYDPHGVWNALRYRQVYAWLPEDARPPIFIGEWGIDGALGRFRDDTWRRQFSDPDAAYMDIIAQYDEELRKDPFVIGFAIYTSGTNGSSAWEPFNIDGTRVARLIENRVRALASTPDPIPSPTPQPEPEPMPTQIKRGDRVEVIKSDLRARQQPGLDSQTQRIMLVGAKATVISDPVSADGIDWPGLLYDQRPVEFSSANYLRVTEQEPTPEPEPEPRPTGVVYSNDWTHGQAAIPGHDNIRVPLDADGSRFEIEYLDGTAEPRLPDSDPTSLDSHWLAPESTMRSGDTALYPFTERLPDSELDLYLTPDSPIVYHIFKRYGKQWWKLSRNLPLPAGRYRFSVEVYPDIYSGPHVWAPDPISGEYRALIDGKDIDDFMIGNFGRWIVLNCTRDHFGGTFRHAVEFRARYGVETVGLFLRRWKVERL